MALSLFQLFIVKILLINVIETYHKITFYFTKSITHKVSRSTSAQKYLVAVDVAENRNHSSRQGKYSKPARCSSTHAMYNYCYRWLLGMIVVQSKSIAYHNVKSR